MKNLQNLQALNNRKKVMVHEKIEIQNANSHLVNSKRIKLYDYYICDYCESEIKILNKKQEMTGGIIKLTSLVTRRGDLELALCNKCLKPVLKLFE